jgi:hypothetical protein
MFNSNNNINLIQKNKRSVSPGLLNEGLDYDDLQYYID